MATTFMDRKIRTTHNFVWVKPVIKKGVGLWLMVFCPAGHLLNQYRRGEWSQARKLRKVKCYSCAE